MNHDELDRMNDEMCDINDDHFADIEDEEAESIWDTEAANISEDEYMDERDGFDDFGWNILSKSKNIYGHKEHNCYGIGKKSWYIKKFCKFSEEGTPQDD